MVVRRIPYIRRQKKDAFNYLINWNLSWALGTYIYLKDSTGFSIHIIYYTGSYKVVVEVVERFEKTKKSEER